ncbi:hypothetical protein [Streptosporangium sp. KLBMP 9127]|nr:hypothetical protein [Streptosporangium sp. KLBMP 9127]
MLSTAFGPLPSGVGLDSRFWVDSPPGGPTVVGVNCQASDLHPAAQ